MTTAPQIANRLAAIDWTKTTPERAQIILSLTPGTTLEPAGFGWTMTAAEITGPIMTTPGAAVQAWIEAAPRTPT